MSSPLLPVEELVSAATSSDEGAKGDDDYTEDSESSFDSLTKEEMMKLELREAEVTSLETSQIQPTTANSKGQKSNLSDGGKRTKEDNDKDSPNYSKKKRRTQQSNNDSSIYDEEMNRTRTLSGVESSPEKMRHGSTGGARERTIIDTLLGCLPLEPPTPIASPLWFTTETSPPSSGTGTSTTTI
jgi:hypothetical protein